MVRFVQDWIKWSMESPEDLDARNKAHLEKVVKGAEVLKAGWAETLLPKGYWNMPAFTASNAELRAEAKGFPANPYEVALEDVEASAKLREAQSKK